MKTIFLTAVLILLPAASSSAQLKSQSPAERSASASLVRPGGAGAWGGGLSSLFGLLDPDRFLMRHTFAYNFMSGGGTGLSVASYTNSMFYTIADPLNVRFDVTLQGSPFGPTAGAERSDLNRLYLSRAELNYRPSDNLFLQLQYRELPYTLYHGWFDPWYTAVPRGDR